MVSEQGRGLANTILCSRWPAATPFLKPLLTANSLSSHTSMAALARHVLPNAGIERVKRLPPDESWVPPAVAHYGKKRKTGRACDYRRAYSYTSLAGVVEDPAMDASPSLAEWLGISPPVAVKEEPMSPRSSRSLPPYQGYPKELEATFGPAWGVYDRMLLEANMEFSAPTWVIEPELLAAFYRDQLQLYAPFQQGPDHAATREQAARLPWQGRETSSNHGARYWQVYHHRAGRGAWGQAPFQGGGSDTCIRFTWPISRDQNDGMARPTREKSVGNRAP